MVAVKAQDADRLVARPPADAAFFLVYGPDPGLAAERAGKLANADLPKDDPFALIRLDGAGLGADPSRLADEAYAVPMFGGRRAIWLREVAGRPTLVAAIAALIKTPPTETRIVVEAGDLKKTHALRALFERERAALAIPCFADDAGAIGRLVDEECAAAGLAIAPDARALLVDLLGGDRLLSRGEIAKLCLYARGSERITVADVEAMVGDSAGVTTDEIIDAAATGDIAALSQALTRAASEGLAMNALAGSALRHFQMLDLARAEVDSGKSAAAVVETLRPPVFFQRKGQVTRALSLWSAPRLRRALAILADAVRESRLNAGLASELVGEALFTIARAAASPR